MNLTSTQSLMARLLRQRRASNGLANLLLAACMVLALAAAINGVLGRLEVTAEAPARTLVSLPPAARGRRGEAHATRQANRDPALRVAMLAGALLASVAAAQPPAAPAFDAAFDNALVAYERNHWDEAYTALAQLADRGHPQAARMALQMWRFGQKLYRMDFSASPAQLERWTRMWLCASGAAAPACTKAAYLMCTYWPGASSSTS